LHGASGAGSAHRIPPGDAGPQRLGARSEKPDADLQDAASRPARRLADRASLRRGHDRRRRHGAREGVRGRGGASAGVLIPGVAPKDKGPPPQRPSSPPPAVGGSCTQKERLYGGTGVFISKEEFMKSRPVSIFVALVAVLALAGSAVAQQPAKPAA